MASGKLGFEILKAGSVFGYIFQNTEIFIKIHSSICALWPPFYSYVFHFFREKIFLKIHSTKRADAFFCLQTSNPYILEKTTFARAATSVNEFVRPEIYPMRKRSCSNSCLLRKSWHFCSSLDFSDFAWNKSSISP